MDWPKSIRKYFFRVLGIGIVYVGVLFVIFMVIGVLAIIPFLPSILGKPSWPTSPPTPPPSLFPLSYVFPVVFAVVQSVFYVILAPAVLDDQGVGGSIDQGLKAVKGRFQAFLGYVGFVCAVMLISSTLSSLKLPPLVGSFTLSGVVSEAITAFISPLFFLIAFLIYAGSKPSNK